ncbi:hypothetical protein R69927_07705 [Paraburkholderia domus]|uniref:hypothetical protein n=1 Tax=Paraburkholderia domus TaxID=2793075 RepID=UPI001911D5A0|nr:hypothetical protein [Paraburkholderia domus]MBK5091726.1 hypothetical protein [Burkholderia sp. R-69927]CAE6941282.1 hypothetical protein R69927_07705 [Paraburkholderia domus]
MPNTTYDRYYETRPQLTEADATPTWVTRGRSFVVTVSQVNQNARLIRDSACESMLILPPQVSAVITTDDETLNAGADSLTILPQGQSALELTGTGTIVRIFTTAESDLCAAATNHATYADVAPLGTSASHGLQRGLRHYALVSFLGPENPALPMRIFRSQHLMVNIFAPAAAPRDLHRLTPHSHADFEQGSLAVSGMYTHHMRYPWGADFEAWREDEHVTMESPSLVVIPQTVIHTTANVTGRQDRLIDVFSPPRADFLAKPGFVCNAADYAAVPITE